MPRPAPAPQQDRSVRTREKLLRATYGALVAVGYAGTTTNEVCRRAKVTRGTLLHHFPSRAALMAAAVHFVYAEELATLQTALDKLPRGKRRATQAVARTFQALQGPAFYAWLELVVASRTDAELRRHVRTVQRQMRDTNTATFFALFDNAGAALRLHDGTELLGGATGADFTLGMLSWLAVDRITLGADDPLILDRLRALQTMVESALAESAPPQARPGPTPRKRRRNPARP